MGESDAHVVRRGPQHGLTEVEVQYLRRREWAQSADDVLWRRTKLGLHLAPSEQGRLTQYMAA